MVSTLSVSIYFDWYLSFGLHMLMGSTLRSTQTLAFTCEWIHCQSNILALGIIRSYILCICVLGSGTTKHCVLQAKEKVRQYKRQKGNHQSQGEKTMS